MDATAENKNRYMAMAITALIHAILFLLLIFIVFVTPIPPFEIKPVPEIEIGLGVEGLGNADAGGAGQHDNSIATNNNSTNVNDNSSSSNIMTDDTEPTAVVKTNPKNNKDDNKVEEPKEDKELLAALAALKNKNRNDGKGEGDGTGGSGTGNNNGVGDGNSTGHGNGPPGFNGGDGWDLNGRMLVKKPERMTDAEEEGKVRIDIIVNEDGKVIKASYSPKGSNTTNARLISKATQAAYQYKFNKSADGKSEQYGTVTVHFSLE